MTFPSVLFCSLDKFSYSPRTSDKKGKRKNLNAYFQGRRTHLTQFSYTYRIVLKISTSKVDSVNFKADKTLAILKLGET